VGRGTKLLGSRILNFGPCVARECTPNLAVSAETTRPERELILNIFLPNLAASHIVLLQKEPSVDLHVNFASGVAANRLAVKVCGSDDDDVSPRDVTDHVIASARRARPSVQPCSPQPVDTAWSLLAIRGYLQL